MLRIENAIDMHCHFGPDAGVPPSPSGEQVPSVTGLQAAQEALGSGHRALVLKSHSFASPQMATAVQEATPGLRVFGGVCTDYPTGGLNVFGVEVALRMGARIVWLPTIHSHQDWLTGKGERMRTRGDGIHVTDADGEPVEEVKAIFELVRQHDAILATGHTTAAEHYAVIKAFARQGKLLVTHAGEALAGPGLTPEQCRELADLGATIEICAMSCQHVFGVTGKSHRDVAQMIRTIGHERCTLASDYGWGAIIPKPAAGLQDFLERLWGEGLTEAELTRMAATRPAELLGL